MTFLVLLVGIIWAAGTIKLVLFWMYLWQLKEYHVGRFIDHFRTAKGKRIIFSYVSQLLFWRIKKPVFTFKAILITGLALLATGVYWMIFFNDLLMLVIYNLLTPVIVSAIVLGVQPLFVLARIGTLKKAAQKRAGSPHLKVIGITGSYGKTSTKEFLKTILSEKFRVLATDKHKNSEMGLAATILKELKPDHQLFIAEMGAYKKGGIKLLCDMVKPEIGVVTGVNEQHLALFGSLENLLSAEGGRELLAELPGHGLLVVNGDNKYCVDLYKKANIRKLTYTATGDKVHSDIWSEEVMVAKDHVSFVALTHERHMAQFAVEVLGRQHVQNLLAAILIAHDLGMGLDEISAACKKITQEQGGMTLRKGLHRIDIVDSSYSSNPDGVIADLDYLSIFPGKRVIIMPCLIELGSKSVEVHYEIGKKIAAVCDMAIITTKDQFEQIKRGAVENGMSEKNIVFLESPQEIFTKITTFCTHGDAVLLEGRVPSEIIRLLHGK